MRRPSFVTQLVCSAIALVGIALYEQYNVGWHASTEPVEFAITEIGAPILPASDITPAAIETIVEVPAEAEVTRPAEQVAAAACGCKGECKCSDADHCQAKSCKANVPAQAASNRKTIATGDQQCRLNPDGTSSCASGQKAASGPVRRFYRNGGLFRRGWFRGRCRGGC